MAKINSFTKSNIKSVRSQIQQKLDELKELGIEVKLGNINFDRTSIKSSVKVQIIGAEDEYEKMFKLTSLGKKYPSLVGQQIVLDGSQYKFRGLRPRARPRARVRTALIESSNGQLYNCDLAAIIKQNDL